MKSKKTVGFLIILLLSLIMKLNALLFIIIASREVYGIIIPLIFIQEKTEGSFLLAVICLGASIYIASQSRSVLKDC